MIHIHIYIVNLYYALALDMYSHAWRYSLWWLILIPCANSILPFNQTVIEIWKFSNHTYLSKPPQHPQIHIPLIDMELILTSFYRFCLIYRSSPQSGYTFWLPKFRQRWVFCAIKDRVKRKKKRPTLYRNRHLKSIRHFTVPEKI